MKTGRFTLTGAFLTILCVSGTLWAAMSDSKAATEAFKLWGSASRIQQVRKWGESNWTKQIGFMSPGCQDEFTVVGSGFNTWDAAFASLPADKGIGGNFAGVDVISARLDTTMTGSPVGVQFMIDNIAVGNRLVPADNGEAPGIKQVLTNWDSRTVPDGFHVLCAVLTYQDATTGRTLNSKTHATMLIVKQP